MAVATSPRLLTSGQVAEILGVSRERVQILARQGTLTPIRFGPKGRLRFRVEDVERLIAGEGP